MIFLYSRSFPPTGFHEGCKPVSRLSSGESMVLAVRRVLLLGGHASHAEHAGRVLQARYAH